jgi:putative ABC transport system permease protein
MVKGWTMNKREQLPPSLARRFFRWYCHPKLVDHIEGDLFEVYRRRTKELGKRRADLKFIIDVLLLFRRGIIKPAEGYSRLNTFGMYKSYLKIGWRTILRNKGYSFINISGLALGMATAMLIGLWIYDEVSANKHHKNFSTLYQVAMHRTSDGTRLTNWGVPLGLGEELQNKFADFKAVAMCDWGGEHTLTKGGNRINKYTHFMGEEAVDMFSLNILEGDKNPLHDPYSIVLTDETAQVLFGHANPIGKIIKMDNAYDLKVTAVVSKQPKSANLQFDALLPWALQERMNPNIKQYKTNWGNNSWQAFVQLNEKADPETVNANIKNVVLNHFLNDPLVTNSIKPEIFIFPMAKWRLYSEFENGINTGGFIKYVRMFGILGLVVLLIAAINFMNLSTARSQKRAKEIGVRKVVGSGRRELINQFMSESMLISFFAFLFAIVIVGLALPFFNELTGKNMSLRLTDPMFWGILISFTLCTGITSGSYPALYLSSFNAVSVIKNNLLKSNGGSLPRKVLVVTQFACSLVLMIGTIVIYLQIQHGKDRPVGYDISGLISINYSRDLEKNFDALQNELISSGAALSICKSNSVPTEIWAVQGGWEWQGSNPSDKMMGFSTVATEYDFAKTLGIKMVEGRDFSRDFPSDSSALIINQATVKRLGFKNPIGEIVKWNGKPRTVVGVVPDMQMGSPFNSVSPLMIVFYKGWVNRLCVRINPGLSASEALSGIKSIFDKYNPGVPFEYEFADDQYAGKFNYEELVGNLALVLTALAILISCLGLFGLSSFMAEQRTQEIGVRKVMGASVFVLWKMLTKNFVLLVIISILIAVPVSYYMMLKWLQSYEYRIEIVWWIFAAAGSGALAITLITVSYQSIKAASANPVASLRSE